MDWIDILFVALAGAISAAIAHVLLMGKAKDRKGIRAVVTVILFLVVNTICFETILPRLHDWETDRELRQMPFYDDLAQYEPQTYGKIKVTLSETLGKGKGVSAAGTLIAPMLTGILSKYIGTASDDSVNEFDALALRELEELQRTNPSACYFYLFPQERRANEESGTLDKKYLDDSVTALGGILHSAIHTPQPLPDRTKAQELLAPIQQRLAKEYGAELKLFAQKPTDVSGREKVCQMTISLYKDIATLPPKDASVLMRHLLGAETGQTTP